VTGLRRRRVAVTAAFFGYAILPGVWAARIPAVQDARHLSYGALGLCLLVPALAAVLVMPVAGAVVTRFGRRRAATSWTVLMCAAMPFLAAAPDLGGFIAALAGFGASAAALDVAINVEAVAVESAYGRSLLPGMHGAWSAGAGAGTLGGIAAAAAGATPTWTLSMAAAVVAAVVLTCAQALPVHEPPAGPRPPAWLPPTRRTVRLGLLVFCSLFVEATAADWSAVYLHRSTGASKAVAGAGFAAFSAAMVAGRLGAGWFVDRFGPTRVARWPALAGAVVLAAALATTTFGAGIVGFALAGFGTAVLFPLAMVATGGDGRSIASAATVGYVGWLVAPAVIGAVASVTSLPLAVGMAAGMLALAAALARSLTAPR
jgi:MFS family permease